MLVIRLYSWVFLSLVISQMVNMVQKQQISNKIIIPNNICLSNFALESLPVGVLDHALLLCRCCRGWTPPR